MIDVGTEYIFDNNEDLRYMQKNLAMAEIPSKLLRNEIRSRHGEWTCFHVALQIFISFSR